MKIKQKKILTKQRINDIVRSIDKITFHETDETNEGKERSYERKHLSCQKFGGNE